MSWHDNCFVLDGALPIWPYSGINALRPEAKTGVQNFLWYTVRLVLYIHSVLVSLIIWKAMFSRTLNYNQHNHQKRLNHMPSFNQKSISSEQCVIGVRISFKWIKLKHTYVWIPLVFCLDKKFLRCEKRQIGKKWNVTGKRAYHDFHLGNESHRGVNSTKSRVQYTNTNSSYHLNANKRTHSPS